MSGSDRSGCRGRRHGSISAYNHHGCRCPEIREAARIYRKRLREGRAQPGFVPATGARRRLQALMALGWPQHELARRLGWCDGETVGNLLRQHVIRRSTHTAVAALFTRLCMTPGPSAITRGRARAAGYPPPLAWGDIDHDPEPVPPSEPETRETDPVAVLRAVAGDPPATLTRDERLTAVAELDRRGLSNVAIAHTLRVQRQVVKKDLEALRGRKRSRHNHAPDARHAVQSPARARGNTTARN